ncbi:hypothetical protein EYF80_015734 [Liparis tanakae]|uniref:Uncharacterized protein n=1 Tax=Liparis tanakae TaxID=230148 RepID=A0A4Z2IAC4_9TELE|nr:hypothetical protein EYF80_015734 [Liparis tanakae]
METSAAVTSRGREPRRLMRSLRCRDAEYHRLRNDTRTRLRQRDGSLQLNKLTGSNGYTATTATATETGGQSSRCETDR